MSESLNRMKAASKAKKKLKGEVVKVDKNELAVIDLESFEVPKELMSITNKKKVYYAFLMSRVDEDETMSQRKIADMIGVHFNTLTNWKSTQEYKMAFNFYMKEVFHELLVDSAKALQKQLKSRHSTKSAELVLKINKMIDTDSKTEVNINIDNRSNDDIQKRITILEQDLDKLDEG